MYSHWRLQDTWLAVSVESLAALAQFVAVGTFAGGLEK